jgi:hypothetical protein
MNLKEIGKGKENIGVIQSKGILERAFENAIWKISRWNSEADRKAGKIYSEEEALKLFRSPQFTEIKGNLLLNEGINELWTILCSASGTKFDNANAQTGIGNNTGPNWAASTAYSLGNVVTPTTANNCVYECTTAGTSGTIQPTWPTTEGATVVDNTVTWTCHTQAANAAQTNLVGNSKTFVGMMAGFPTYGTAQKATWKSSYDGTTANYAWEEFVVRNGATALKDLCRKVSAQGTKISGQIWELSLEITLS